MNRILTTLLVLSLLAAAAAAQERERPGIPARPKDGVKMTPPPGKEGEDGKNGEPEEGEEKGKGEKPAEAPPKPAKDPFELALEKLAIWPADEAREAAATLALGGPEQEPRLLEALKGAKPPVAAGICFVLGEIVGDASLPAVQATAARRDMADYLPVLFDALGKLDGIRAVRRVFPFLRHPMRPAREAAEEWLRSRVTAEHAPRLVELLGDRSRGTRLSALRLLLHADPERAREEAVELLRDPAPELARTAADILSTDADEETIARLNALTADIDSRRAAYAVLALVLVEEKTGRRVYTAETRKELLGTHGLAAPEKLNRGVAAIALADIGYDSEIPEVDALLDREVVLTLLNTIGGRTYFKDYGAIADLARNRFGKLTGILDRRPVPELWKWWSGVEGSFTARRSLRRLPEEGLADLRVRARSLAEPALPATLFSTVASDARAPDVLGIGFVYLPPEEARTLAGLIGGGFLDLPDRGGVDPVEVLKPGAVVGADVAVSVSAGNRSRTIVARRDDVPAPLLPILDRLSEIRRTYDWQQYWDRASYPRYEDFIRKEAEFFGAGHPEPVREEHLKALILSALDDLATIEERTAAVRRIRKMEVPLTDSEAYRLAALVDGEQVVSPFVEEVVEVLGAGGRSLVLPMLADWFERQPDRRALDLYVRLLVRFGPEEVEKAARSGRLFLRRAAIRAAPDTLSGDALVTLLASATKDDAPRIRREALEALGRTGADWAFPILDAGTRDPEASVAAAAIEALGALGSAEVIPALVRELGSEDPARRVASVTALCRTGRDDALRPVLVALSGDPAAVVRGVAAREVTGFGVRALGGLSKIVTDPEERSDVRAMTVEALLRIGGDHVLDILKALVADPEDRVADAAAWGLAARGSKAAAERLLDAIEKGRNPVRALAALEQLSCQSFPSARADELPAIYRGWWKERKTEPEVSWFVQALRRRGYESPALEGLATGSRDAAAIPVLIDALGDPAWFIRANANLWLGRIAAESFGEVSRFTREEDVLRIQARWRAWWEER